MKKLKKLTRKGLDELANEMPQVNELQQRECVGGYQFFVLNNNGKVTDYVPIKIGDSDEIRVVTSDQMGLALEGLTNGVGLFDSNEAPDIVYNVVLSNVSYGNDAYLYYTNYFDIVPDQNGIMHVYIPSSGSLSYSDLTGRVAAINAYYESGMI